jgi:DNA-binding beta-propeller fold protein YncE
VAKAPDLNAVPRARVRVPPDPFGVVSTANGRWSFVALGSSVAVMANQTPRPPARAEAPVLVRQLKVPGFPAGERLTHNGRYLLAAEAGGAVVINVAKAEHGTKGAVVGTLSGKKAGSGAIEVAVSPDDRYAFVSEEDSESLAVFNLHKALTHGFGPADFVGKVPLGIAPVGLAVSPNGKLIYATSEAARAAWLPTRPQGIEGVVGNTDSQVGTLTVIDLRRAETRPAQAVMVTIPAGCSPVRVITSANGSIVWVTARGSDAVLGFSASRLLHRPRHALVAKVQVGSAPVGLALVHHGTRIVVADSDRFLAKGQSSNLAVVNVSAALAGHHALLGLVPTGQFPREMTLIPHTHTLLVGDFDSDQVQAIDVHLLP